MSEFPPEVRARLVAAGWTPDRRIDIGRFEAGLREEGFEASPAVVKFLREFGGLHVRHPLESSRDFHFDPVEALNKVDAGWILGDYSRRVGGGLCVVGEAWDGYMVLAMDAAGRMHGGFDETLVELGPPASAMEALLADRPAPEPPP